MTETEKLIEAQFNRLPAKMQRALNAVPWKSSVKEIALLNKISLEQVEVVERETMFILYGFENPEDYIKNLIREVEIDETTAINIAEAVNEKIFKAIETVSVPEIIPPNLPVVEPDFAQGSVMVKKGEVAHDIAHIEPTTNNLQPTTDNIKPEKPKMPVPDYRYPNGKDPYREPLV